MERTDLFPSAVKIGSEYIEDLIEGYHTTATSGREGLALDMSTITVGMANGDRLRASRRPARQITVSFDLLDRDRDSLRVKLRALNNLLDVESERFIFNDEADVYYIGTPSPNMEYKYTLFGVSGSYTIHCFDPFKYSVTEHEVEPSADNGSTFVVEYAGTAPAYPSFEVDFYQSDATNNTDGNCAFVAFVNDAGKILQFGTPKDAEKKAEEAKEVAEDSSVWYTEKRLLNEPFESGLTGWVANNGFNSDTTNYKQVGTPVCALFDSSSIDKVARASAYGSGKQWHGPTITYTFPSDGGNPAVTGAKDFRWHAALRFAPVDGSGGKKQSGCFQCWIIDSDGEYICGTSVWKSNTSTKGSVRCYINGKGAVKTWENIDLSCYGPYFGFTKNGRSAPSNVDFKKQGEDITFVAGGLTFSISVPSLESKVAAKVCMYFAQWGNETVVQKMGVYTCYFDSLSVANTRTTETVDELVEVIGQTSTFTTNDILVIDCADGTVRLSQAHDDDSGAGSLRPELGALGNDWEGFVLTPGTNQIGIMYSDWVTAGCEPTFIMRYREAYL